MIIELKYFRLFFLSVLLAVGSCKTRHAETATDNPGEEYASETEDNESNVESVSSSLGLASFFKNGVATTEIRKTESESLVYSKNLEAERIREIKQLKNAILSEKLNWDNKGVQKIGTSNNKDVSVSESGRGNFGIVSKVEFTAKDGGKIAYAVKRLKPGARMKDNIDFEKEANRLRILSANNPNVVKFYALIKDPEGNPYLVMEHLEKPELTKEPYNLHQFVEAARGLNGIHKAEYTDGDVKFENMGLAADGSLRITDVGLSFKTKPGRLQTAGTMNIPELMKGRNDYLVKDEKGLWHYKNADANGALYDSTRADIYALALITLQKKYNLMSHIIAKGEYKLNLNDPVDVVLEKALQKDPWLRYSSSDEFLKALEEAEKLTPGVEK